MAITKAYTLGLSGADSDFITNVVDSDYIVARASSFDSANALGLIDSDYIKTVQYLDDEKIYFGTGQDLKIYSDGSNSLIWGEGTSYLRGTTVNIAPKVGGGYVDAVIAGSGSVQIKHPPSNAVKLQTSTTGISVTGTVAATAFTGDGSALTGTGGAFVQEIDIKTADYTVVAGDLGKIIKYVGGNLDRTVTLTAGATLGDGFHVTILNANTGADERVVIDANGTERFGWQNGPQTITLSRGEMVRIIWDNTGGRWIIGEGGFNLAIRADVNPANTAAAGDGANSGVAIGHNAQAVGSLSVALGRSYASGTNSAALAIGNNTNTYGAQHANSVAIGYQAVTTADKQIVLGDASTSVHVGGDATFNGILTGPSTFYIDPAPVDSDAGLLVIRGDLQVDGTTTTVNSTTVTINDKNIVLADSAANASEADGAGITVEGANATITYDATNDEWDFNKEINIPGGKVTGEIQFQGSSYRTDWLSVGHWNYRDNVEARFGNSDDLKIYHSTDNNSYIQESGSGNLRIMADDLRIQATTGHDMINAIEGGAIELYHNTAKKLETVSSGVTITGNATATKFVQSGTAGSIFYAGEFSRSGSGITTPDVWGTNNTFVIGSSSSQEVIGLSGTTSHFYGDATMSWGNNRKLEMYYDSDYSMALEFDANTRDLILRTKAGDGNGDIILQTDNGTGTLSSKLVVKADGNIGIGEPSPNQPLVVKRATDGAVIVANTAQAGGQGIGFFTDTANNRVGVFNNSSYTLDMVFNTGGIGTSGEAMRIDNATKNVGIGTTNPGGLLTVYNSSTAGNTRLHVHNDKNGDAAELRLEGKRTSNNDTGQLLYVNSGNVVSRISANSAADDGDLRFFTSATGTGSAVTERMRITTVGNVSIGSASNPSDSKLYVTGGRTKLEVQNVPNGVIGSNASTVIEATEAQLQIIGVDSGSWASNLTLTNAPASGNNKHWTMHHTPASHPSISNALQFNYLATNTVGSIGGDGTGAASEAKMTITNAGNVGIGTESPSEKLDVKGSFTLRDTTGNLSHGMSVFGDNDQYAIFNQEVSGDGGLRITTLSDASSATSAFQLNAVATTPSTDGNNAVIRLRAAKKSGITETALASTEDVLSIGNTGTELVVVKGSGDVGIGTATPTSGKLHVDGGNLRITNTTDVGIKLRHTSATFDFNILQNSNGDLELNYGPDEKFMIQTNGYLSAQSGTNIRLVLGSAGNPNDNSSNWIRGNSNFLQFNNAGSGFTWETTGTEKMRLNPAGGLELKYATTGDQVGLIFLHDTGTDTVNQKSFIDFSFQDDNTNETPQVRIGANVGYNDGNADTQSKEGSGSFVVYTNNADTTNGAAGASLAERMRVSYNGYVGINTTTPERHLHVHSGTSIVTAKFSSALGGAGASSNVHIVCSGASNSGLSLRMNGSSATTEGGALAATLANTENGPLRLKTNGVERLRLTSDGNARFAESVANEKFSVKGQGRFYGENYQQIKLSSGSNATYAGIQFQDDINATSANGALDGNQLGFIRFTHGDANTSNISGQSGNASFIMGTSEPINVISFQRAMSANSNGTNHGEIRFGNNVSTTYGTSSDRRLKENIINVPAGIGKTKVQALNPVTFNFISDDQEVKNTHTGFIAQEVLDVYPEVVVGSNELDFEGNERMLSMDYGRLTPILVAALQDALAEIETLKSRLDAAGL